MNEKDQVWSDWLLGIFGTAGLFAVLAGMGMGAQGTKIRSGIIGEVGVNARPMTENELKSIRASARASRLTGVPMTIHSFGTPEEML